MQAIVLESTASQRAGATDEAQTAVLRESVRMRCTLTLPAAGGVILIAIVLIALWDEVALWQILAWLATILTGLVFRMLLARRIARRIRTMPWNELCAADRKLRWNSVASQALVGAGIWVIGASGSYDAALFVTFIIALYGVGAMVNLSSDYRSFRASVPFLLAQPIAYWAGEGATGLGMAMSLTVLGGLMLLSVRSSSRTHAESVSMRLEKDALLEELKSQHGNTQRALTLAEEANRSKTAFMAAASHDLRQPLFAISVLAETLLLHELPKAAREMVGQQAQAIGVLRALFDNLLDLSKFEAGAVNAAFRQANLLEVLDPLDGEYGALCRAKGLAWTCAKLPASVSTDSELLLRLLGNLLANAVRYTDKGEVALSARVDGGKVRLEVTDTGPGIDPADHRRIFDEFVQLENPHRSRERGIGLGLSIVRRIDRLLGTELAIDSAIGRGTRFSLSVPLAGAGASEFVTEGAGGHALPPGLTVWLVEDDPLVRSALARQFDAWGVQYRAAVSEAEVRSIHAEDRCWPDAVILDDMLGPDHSGLDIARWLAEHLSPERIVLITGNTDPARIAQLHQSGFDVLRKPVSGEAMRRWLATVVPRRESIPRSALPDA